MKHSARSIQTECGAIRQLLVDVGNGLGLQGDADHGKSMLKNTSASINPKIIYNLRIIHQQLYALIIALVIYFQKSSTR
jgi:hypothetical protein